MRREACAVCEATDLTPILDLGRSPLADSFPSSPDAREAHYDLDLLHCKRCGLVQLGEIVDDDLLFGRDYAFFTGSSPSLVERYRHYAIDAMERYPEQAKQGVVEIASNDGTLLGNFKAAGCPVLGIDPALPPAEEANKKGIHTRIRPFSSREAREITEISHGSHLGSKPGLIVANHVLAHVADQVDFMAGIKLLLAEDGIALIEFQYFPDLFFGNEWDHVYHEHRTFFSLQPLVRLCQRVGMVVLDVRNSPAQGGSLQVVIGHEGCPVPAVNDLIAKESRLGLRDPEVYAGWQNRVEYSKLRLQEIVGGFVYEGKRVAGYGASAKSATLLNYCGFGPKDIGVIEDLTPRKQGLFTPGTHIPICEPPEVRPNAYLLLVWNYLAGVLWREREFMDKGGKFIVPIPHPVIL